MQYQRLQSGNTLIEFHNNWLGQETVIANGQIVSKLSSIMGISHHFTVMEDGHAVRYILTSKVNQNLQVALDLTRNGVLIQNNIPIPYGSIPKKPENKSKKLGLKYLQEYELEECLAEFQKALDLNPRDSETHFHMACAYSIQEETEKGFESLKKSVEFGLQDQEMILNHDMLAFIRMHPSFEHFLNSGFKEIKLS